MVGLSCVGSVFPNHVFEADLFCALGGFLGARAFERSDFAGASDRCGPALGFFEKCECAKSAQFQVVPLGGGVGCFEHRVIGEQCLLFILAGCVRFVWELFECSAAQVLEMVEICGILRGVGEQCVLNFECFCKCFGAGDAKRLDRITEQEATDVLDRVVAGE